MISLLVCDSKVIADDQKVGDQNLPALKHKIARAYECAQVYLHNTTPPPSLFLASIGFNRPRSNRAASLALNADEKNFF